MNNALGFHCVAVFKAFEIFGLVDTQHVEGVVVEFCVNIVELCYNFEHYLFKEIVVFNLLYRRLDFARKIETEF